MDFRLALECSVVKLSDALTHQLDSNWSGDRWGGASGAKPDLFSISYGINWLRKTCVAPTLARRRGFQTRTNGRSGTKGCGGLRPSFSAHVRWCEHGAPVRIRRPATGLRGDLQYPTSREKRARCGAPGDWFGVRAQRHNTALAIYPAVRRQSCATPCRPGRARTPALQSRSGARFRPCRDRRRLTRRPRPLLSREADSAL
jgi:hypothetical protein